MKGKNVVWTVVLSLFWLWMGFNLGLGEQPTSASNPSEIEALKAENKQLRDLKLIDDAIIAEAGAGFHNVSGFISAVMDGDFDMMELENRQLTERTTRMSSLVEDRKQSLSRLKF